MKESIDVLITQENNIQNAICSYIDDKFDELEFYCYSFFIVYDQGKDHELFRHFISSYPRESLVNYTQQQNKYKKLNRDILKHRNKRFEQYNFLWDQLSNKEGEMSSKVIRFFSTVSNNIYGKNKNTQTLSMMHKDILQSISTEFESHTKIIMDIVDPPLVDRIKSFFGK